jgi:hypothetical protein
VCAHLLNFFAIGNLGLIELNQQYREKRLGWIWLLAVLCAACRRPQRARLERAAADAMTGGGAAAAQERADAVARQRAVLDAIGEEIARMREAAQASWRHLYTEYARYT